MLRKPLRKNAIAVLLVKLFFTRSVLGNKRRREETDAEITLFREPKAVKAVNMLEEDEGVKTELKSEGERIKLKMKPFEIVTLKVGL